MRTMSELLQEIVRKYQAANQPWPATSRDIAQWAIAQNLWAPQPSAIVSKWQRDISIFIPNGNK